LNGQVAEAIDVPNSTNTVPEAINPGSVITGYCTDPAGTLAGAWVDVDFVQHGFVRAPDGTITKIDVSGASATNTTGINSVGTVLGYYVDANGVFHGFIRATNGYYHHLRRSRRRYKP
jgi:hypothetical protein